jgi:hypothetical protein
MGLSVRSEELARWSISSLQCYCVGQTCLLRALTSADRRFELFYKALVGLSIRPSDF